jgi:DNA-binding beta-propeller fold protein YncE
VVDSTPKLIRVFDASGKFLRNITHESLERPTGIAVDSVRRRIYVADSAFRKSDNHMIRIFDMDGNYLKAFGGAGYEEGKFFFPTYLAVDSQGNLYVTDTMNARVQAFDPDGRHLRTIGQRGDAFGMFDKPKGVAVDTYGNVYVVDSAWSNVQIFNQRREVLLFFGGRGRFPGLLFNPTGIAIDKENRIYVADAFNRRIGVYQLINTKADDSFIALPQAAQKGG